MKPATQGAWGVAPTRVEPGTPEVDAELSELSALNGQKLGNYVIERPLARGGMAVVYLAKHPTLGREVAVKLLSPEYQGDLDLNRRFLQEARVTAGLRHPNIVEIYDLGEIDGRAYYTMERLEGADLASQLATQERFSHQEVAAYFEQICAALGVAHEVGIVHRDLKPANVFVVSQEPLHLKLVDFGIAKVTEGRQASGTQRGEVLGTPAYMAPEQALGQVDAITASTDIYALGIIAYEMLTGQLPFSADSDLLLLTMHIRDTPRPLRQLAPGTPPAFAALIERCLAKAPSDRPHGARELSLALSRISQHGSPPAQKPRAVEAAAPADGADSELRARAVSELPEAEDSELERIEEEVALEPGRTAPSEPEAADAAPVSEPPEMSAVAERADSRVLWSELTDEPLAPGGPVTLSSGDGKLLDKLLRRMQRRADFPSFLHNVTEISRKADADAEYSAWQLSEAILKDFALTARLLRMVNGLYANRFGGRVFSINQAVLILGFDSVRSMALGVSVYKLSGQKGGARAGRFHEVLAEESINSLISGEIARILAFKAGIKETELAMMCAMFRNLGQHLAMEYLPEEYEKIAQTSRAERVPLGVAAQRVLGISLSKLGIGVAERWSLPKLMRAAMSSNPRPDDALVRDEDKLGALAKLSNDLCYIIASGDRENYKAAIAKLFALHKRLLVLSDQEVTAVLGTVCKSFETRYSALFGPYHRKSRFLFHARDLTGQAPPERRRESPPLSAHDLERIEHRVQVFTDRLQAHVQRRTAADALLSEAASALASLLDTPRATLLTPTNDRKELEVRLALGHDEKSLKSHLRFAVGHGADVFSTALRSGKNVVIADALGPGAMRRVPQKYFEVIGSAAFALYVCAARGYPTCLWLVDADVPEELPSRERELSSKSLRELIAKIAERR